MIPLIIVKKTRAEHFPRGSTLPPAATGLFISPPESRLLKDP